MSTTTALELLEQADLLTRQLRKVDTPTTTVQWESFDVTLHRLLLELIGADAGNVRTADPSWRALHLAIRSYPTPLRPPVDMQLTPGPHRLTLQLGNDLHRTIEGLCTTINVTVTQ